MRLLAALPAAAVVTICLPATSVASGLLLGISGASKAAGAAARQWGDNLTPDHLWSIVDAGGGWFKLDNRNSGVPKTGSGPVSNDAVRVGLAQHLAADDALRTGTYSTTLTFTLSTTTP
jgi:hypothetical protein